MRVLGLIAGATGLLLAACSSAPPPPLTISDVTVSADLPAVGSREAVAYWTNLSTDLETAIAGQFVGSLQPTGKQIQVDVDEISLSSPFSSSATSETARLTGLVTLVNPDGTTAAAYNVSASAQDVQNVLPEGRRSIPPTSGAYYQAIVEAFARGVANTLRQANESNS